ncbi:MAG TPA: PAS domain S-box protein [Nitrospira sp.]|nr:PAS domain S-box protein [Nitrospira sp.]
MIHPVHDALPDALFVPALWDTALEKYACVTNLTVQLFDVEGSLVLGPIHQTPLFQLLDEKKYDPGIFAQCAGRCLAQTDTRPAVAVSQAYGLAAVGTSLMLDGKIVGAAVGGYVFEDFIQSLDIQSLARHGGLDFPQLWDVARRQSPVPRRRLLVYGELLQVLGDALLRENHRTRQYGQAAAIIQSSDDAIISKNLDGIITSWNRGAERLFGYPAAEAIGRPVTMLMPAERFDEEPGILARIRHGESIEHYETVRRRRDGPLFDVSLTVSPLTDAQGRIAGASEVSRDITERKRAESALRRWNDELEARVTERTGELIASQDRLRGLATELNRAEQQERKRLAVELHDHLQQILVLGKLKLGLVKRMAKSLPPCAEMISETDEVLSDALKYTRTLVAELSPPILRDHGLAAGLKWLGDYMKKYNLAVTVTVPEEEPALPEDEVVLLFQSVRELLINSSKYAGTGEAAVTLERRDGRLLIEVSDHGAGFDLSAAISSGSSSKFGLFSIRERMKSLGGSFDLTSAQGQGTTVVLSLPLVDRSRNQARDESSRGAWLKKEQSRDVTIDRRPMSRPDVVQVLLVDDHTMLRQGLRTMLEGYEDVEIVGEAGDGQEAVQAADALRPGVVVMDINMPKMNGIEATAQIKACHPETVVIGLSVNVNGESREAMLKAGATLLLSKEAAIDQLHQSIYAVVHDHSMHQ